MPWDPKPVPVQQPQHMNAGLPSGAVNGLPQSSYGGYENGGTNGTTRIKTEPGMEQPFHGLPNGYAPQQGGAARAQQLVQEQFGVQAAASLNMPRQGLALPGQNQKPQGLQLPGQNQQSLQQQYSQAQQQQAMRQAQQLQQQQQNPRIKVENDSPHLNQSQIQQQQRQANYGQTDGADDGLEEWQTMLAQRRAVPAEQTEHADRLMRDRITTLSENLESGLMMPLDEQQSRLQSRKRKATAARRQTATADPSSSTSGAARASIPQMDGELDDDDDTKDNIKDEEDEDAINSDLDDSGDDQDQMGDEEDDLGDTILCTYDKVQRVKNKWKCTLKDGVLNTGGKEYLFHKAQGEFEW